MARQKNKYTKSARKSLSTFYQSLLDLFDNWKNVVWTKDFFVRQRQFFAGILYVFQEKLAKYDGKRTVQTAFWRLSNRSIDCKT